jgi:hypothetical protein
VPFPDLLGNYTGFLFQLVKVLVAAVPNHALICVQVQQPLVIFGPVTFLWPVRRYFGLIQVLPALDVTFEHVADRLPEVCDFLHLQKIA